MIGNELSIDYNPTISSSLPLLLPCLPWKLRTEPLFTTRYLRLPRSITHGIIFFDYFLEQIDYSRSNNLVRPGHTSVAFISKKKLRPRNVLIGNIKISVRAVTIGRPCLCTPLCTPSLLFLSLEGGGQVIRYSDGRNASRVYGFMRR